MIKFPLVITIKIEDIIGETLIYPCITHNKRLRYVKYKMKGKFEDLIIFKVDKRSAKDVKFANF